VSALNPLFAPIRLLMDRPYLALIPALILGVGYWTGRPEAPKTLLIAAVTSALYSGYETYMHAWSKTVTAPIRVDLLLLTPVLYLLTLIALVSWWRAAHRP
jgi:hypothetical protein